MAGILIADDDAHMLHILSIWLRRNGHEVCEASDGLVAQGELRSRTFDCVVSDVNMPGLDGISLVRWLRGDCRSDVPVILLSSRCDQRTIAQQVDSLDIQVFPKPFSPSRLVAEIERRMRVSRDTSPRAGRTSRVGGPEPTVAEDGCGPKMHVEAEATDHD